VRRHPGGSAILPSRRRPARPQTFLRSRVYFSELWRRSAGAQAARLRSCSNSSWTSPAPAGAYREESEGQRRTGGLRLHRGMTDGFFRRTYEQTVGGRPEHRAPILSR